ncbi:hypothetical protein [Rhodopseudomonas palustris]|uniref:hypothetical protein n=1 Tax=Rhodopseudomonas palustris TaxID=1076 RepID=UPI000CEC0CB0|nr:hypothetical protein [Rhodopseudomonas palustris]PPQ42119.1 hypothetical protein CKO39_18185 [Rhodopseudomonas palustris]
MTPTSSHTFYLCFRKKTRVFGLSVRCTERLPSLDSGEVAIKVTAELPDALFRKPLLEAKITVPADKVSPAKIDASVADNITDVVRQNLGIDLQIKLEQMPSAERADAAEQE